MAPASGPPRPTLLKPSTKREEMTSYQYEVAPDERDTASTLLWAMIILLLVSPLIYRGFRQACKTTLHCCSTEIKIVFAMVCNKTSSF